MFMIVVRAGTDGCDKELRQYEKYEMMNMDGKATIYQSDRMVVSLWSPWI